MTPEKFKELQDYFWHNSLFYGTVINEHSSSNDWIQFRDEVQILTAGILDDDQYLVNLEWLREPMRTDQREGLQDTIESAINKLESPENYERVNTQRLEEILYSYPADISDADTILECFNHINSYITTLLYRLIEACNIIRNNVSSSLLLNHASTISAPQPTVKQKLSNRQWALKLALEGKTVTKEEYGNDIYNKHQKLKLRSDRTAFANENWPKAKPLLRDYLFVLPTLRNDLISSTKEEMKVIATGHGKDIDDEQLIEKLKSL